jgi:hypothetical protein
MTSDLTESQAIAYLTKDGANLGVPCSRYGRTSAECAPVAYKVATIYRDLNGEAITVELLDYLMGLVVNDHDDIEEIIIDNMIEDDTSAPFYA